MRRLAKPWEQEFPTRHIGGLAALQDRLGRVFLAVNEAEDTVLAVYRWQGGKIWERLCALPGLCLSAEPTDMDHLCFEVSEQDLMVWRVYAPSDGISGLLVMNGEGDVRLRVRLPGPHFLAAGSRRIDRFSNGDFLLDQQEDLLRIGTAGEVLWRYARPALSKTDPDAVLYWEALADDTTALWVRDAGPTVHLELLSPAGRLLDARRDIRAGIAERPHLCRV